MLFGRRRLALASFGVVAIAATLVIAVSSALGTGHPAVGAGPVAPRGVVATGETFYKAIAYNVAFNTGETMTLSGSADGTGTTLVDDLLQIQVKHQDGSKLKVTVDYSHGCSALTAAAPRDITSMFKPGLNIVTLTLKDKCGGAVSSTPLFVS